MRAYNKDAADVIIKMLTSLPIRGIGSICKEIGISNNTMYETGAGTLLLAELPRRCGERIVVKIKADIYREPGKERDIIARVCVVVEVVQPRIAVLVRAKFPIRNCTE